MPSQSEGVVTRSRRWGAGRGGRSTLRPLLVASLSGHLHLTLLPSACGKAGLSWSQRTEGFLRCSLRGGRAERYLFFQRKVKTYSLKGINLELSSPCFSLPRRVLVNQILLLKGDGVCDTWLNTFPGLITQSSTGKTQTALNIIKSFFDDS